MIESFMLVSGLFALMSVLKDIKNKQHLFWLFTILLVFFYGTRWEMGTDWTSYYNYFQVANTYRQPGFEPGFVLYTTVIRNITANYTVYLLITAAITFIGIYVPIFKMTNGSFLSIFYLTSTLTWYACSLRQMIACVFFVHAVKAIFDRRPVKYLLLMVAGMAFHTTMVVYMPMYFLFGVSVTGFVLVFVLLSLVAVFARNLVILLSLLTSYVYGTDVTRYIGGTLAQSDPLFGFLRKVLTTVGLIGFTFTAKTSPQVDQTQWQRLWFALMMSCLSIILYYVGTYDVANVSSRLDIYTGILCTGLLIGFLERAFTRRVNKAFLFVFVVVIVVVFYIRLGPNDLFHPYSSIFYNYDLHRDLY